jgi:ketosteroid isomerase-like protein
VTSPAGWPEPGPFNGRDAIARQFERLASDWEEHHFENLDLAAKPGNWVIVTFQWHTRGVGSGLETQFDLAGAYRVGEGQIVEAHFRWTRDEALEAAGLSE